MGSLNGGLLAPRPGPNSGRFPGLGSGPSASPIACRLMGENAALRFAEQLLELIDTTAVTTTYKYAVILCLCDAAEDHTKANGDPPDVLFGKEIARRVVELYWPQTISFATALGAELVLRQSAVNDIPSRLAQWRVEHALSDRATIADARDADPTGWDEQYLKMEAQVIRQPLARLQRFGSSRNSNERRFIYDFSWDDQVSDGAVAGAAFDDSLRLCDGVGEWLVRFGPLVRPLVKSRFVARVAERNQDDLGRSDLEEFLFGAARISLERVRVPLAEAQRGHCFYCEHELDGDQVEVDHFLPWSRRPDNHLDNLVAAHRRCNGAKSASFAATHHLRRWLRRFRPAGEAFAELEVVKEEANWPRNPQWTLAKARASYLWLPPESRLWIDGSAYEEADHLGLRSLLLAESEAR